MVVPKAVRGTAMSRKPSQKPNHQDSDNRESSEFTEQYLLDRLTAAGVGSLDDWRALSPRAKHSIFGITVGIARAIDGMANTQRPSES